MSLGTPVKDAAAAQAVNPFATLQGLPAGAIVVPGSRSREFPSGSYGLPAGLIIGYRSEATESKLQLNDLLREFGSSVGS